MFCSFGSFLDDLFSPLPSTIVGPHAPLIDSHEPWEALLATSRQQLLNSNIKAVPDIELQNVAPCKDIAGPGLKNGLQAISIASSCG